MQQDYTKIDEEHLKYLLDQAFGVIQGSLKNLSQAELKALELIVHNTRFFQRVLGPQINLYDFLERIKHRLGYKMYPSGTIITPEGGSVPKLSIIVRGKALRFRPRAQVELEKEVMENYLGPDPMEDEESKEDMVKLKQFLQKAKGFTEIAGIMKRFERCTQHISNLLPAPEIERGERMLRRGQTTLINVESSEKQNSPLSSEQAQPEGRPVFRKQRSTKSFTMLQLGSAKVVESPLKRSEEIKNQKEQQDKKNKEIALEAFILELDREREEDENKTDSDEDSPKRQQMKRLLKNSNLQKDLALTTQILKKNPKQEPMFYIGGGEVLRNERVKEYVPGSYFGEHFLKSNKPKESLLIASEDLYVLTIDKQDVSELVTQLYDEATEKANFFLSLFPSAANEEDVKSLSYHFREEVFQKDEKIFVEGESTKGIYILKSGNVGLIKKVENPIKEKQSSSEILLLNANRTQKVEVALAEIIEGHFFGDELLLDERKRKTTAICKAMINKVFYLEIDAFHLIKEEFTKLFKLLRTHAKERSGWRQERLENMAERAINNMNLKQMDFSDTTPKASSPEGKGFSRVKIAPIVTKGLNSAENKEVVDDYEKEGKTPGSSKKKSEITSPRKNMDLYKEKFSRKTYIEKTTSQVESPRKSVVVILKPKGGRTEIEKEVIIPVIREKKKQLSGVIYSSLPKIDTRYNGYVETEGNDFSPVSPGRFVSTILSARASHANVFQALSPEQSQGTMEGVIRNNDGSLTVVAGRSRLRSILNNFDKPHLEERLLSPQIKMNSSSLSPKKVNPKIAPKLKQIKKITGGSIGGPGDIFKSPRATAKEMDSNHSQMLKALMITKAKI